MDIIKNLVGWVGAVLLLRRASTVLNLTQVSQLVRAGKLKNVEAGRLVRIVPPLQMYRAGKEVTSDHE
jgi:hypothetical protein